MLEQLHKRRTYKIIGTPEQPENAESTNEAQIDSILAAAGNAPFHYASDRVHHAEMPSPVPWRVYKLRPNECRKLMQKLIDNGDPTKVPNMLAAAQYLLQVTWLPDAGYEPIEGAQKDQPLFAGTLRNMEHLAAAGAFVQSLLLAAENQEFRTYWSSGGALRGKEVFNWLNIPSGEMLIGSIFLYPTHPIKGVTKPGGMAEKRGEVKDWSRWQNITS